MAVDGVPKEGLRVQDVLVRIAVLGLIRDKVSSLKKLTECLTVHESDQLKLANFE